MVKPDNDTYTALAQFSQTAQWTLFEKWLQECREAAIAKSLSTDDVICRQAQGQMQAIDRILKETRAAESVTRR